MAKESAHGTLIPDFPQGPTFVILWHSARASHGGHSARSQGPLFHFRNSEYVVDRRFSVTPKFHLFVSVVGGCRAIAPPCQYSSMAGAGRQAPFLNYCKIRISSPLWPVHGSPSSATMRVPQHGHFSIPTNSSSHWGQYAPPSSSLSAMNATLLWL